MMLGPSPASTEPALCVDLDGTLVRTDTLVESVLVLVKTNPLAALLLPVWLLRGRAHLKRQVAARVRLDPATLPYHTELLAHLHRERDAGRKLVLVSAADEGIVRAVAAHVGIFDEVIASDGTANLKGAEKRAVLAARFGSGGYDYAGDHAADLDVWNDARGAIVVGTTERVARRATRVQHTFIAPVSRASAVARALRLQQWVKNALVFVPLLMAPEVRHLALFGNAFVAFVAFSLCASSVYVMNDLLDLEDDRRHETKRRRPFASGDLPLLAGFVLAPLALWLGLACALWLPPAFALVLAVYMVTTTAYSLRLKYVPLVDVLVLALLYTGRVIAGAAATRVSPSPWILGFSLFFFLSLAFVKRYSELHALRQRDQGALKVRGYYPTDLELIATEGTASGYISVLVAALYINSDRVTQIYSQPLFLWMVCPLLLYWISRIWLLARRGQLHDDPVLFAVRDRVSYLVGALITAVLLLARLA